MWLRDPVVGVVEVHLKRDLYSERHCEKSAHLEWLIFLPAAIRTVKDEVRLHDCWVVSQATHVRPIKVMGADSYPTSCTQQDLTVPVLTN